MKNFFEDALNFLFPKTCIICGKLEKNLICEKCSKKFKKYEIFNVIDVPENIKKNVYFDSLFSCYYYKGLFRKILLSYKFNGKSYLCNYFAKMLLNCKKTHDFFSIYDIIIPVPMYKEKKLERGYNQTELITDIIAENTGIFNGKALVNKIKKTKTQSLLNLEERKENVENAFSISNKELLKNKNIILFDDICTTGFTVNEISKILKENGAKKIIVLVLAKD